MNSEGNVVLYLFAIIAAMNTVHFVSGQHMPLYITHSQNRYEYILANDVIHNKEDQHLVISNSGAWIVFLACPRNDDPTSLEIRDKVTQASIGYQCKTPVESRIFLPRIGYHHLPDVIGFLVFIPNTPPTRDYAVPPNHELVEFIRFKFDESIRRIKMVSYCLGSGNVLKPEISAKNDGTEEYQKDETFFLYDLDELYSKTELPMIKVQLAPKDDFFFDNLKSASKHNVITAPMWSDWLPQWQALAKFTRKVNQIVNSVNVKAGVYDTLTTQSELGLSQKIYLHDRSHPIPKYFWKFIYIKTRTGDYHIRIYGRLFVMPNVDPNTQQDEEKICPVEDDITKTGWKFLPDDNEFKTSMYVCTFDAATLKSFPEALLEFDSLYAYDYKPLDLNEVPVTRLDDNGRIIDTVIVNVIEEMRLKEAKDVLFE